MKASRLLIEKIKEFEGFENYERGSGEVTDP